MTRLTVVFCRICGDSKPYPWKKEDRKEHFDTHMDDVFDKIVIEEEDGDRADMLETVEWEIEMYTDILLKEKKR